LLVRDARIAKESGICGDSGAYVDFGNWGHYRDFQRCEHRAAAAVAVWRSGATGAHRGESRRRDELFFCELPGFARGAVAIGPAGEAYRPWTFNVSGGAEPAQTEGAMISAGLFDALGVRPELGRGFTADEQRESANSVTVLSYGLWQRQFGGDSGVIGRTIRVSDVPHVVVGVMPAGFEFPQDTKIWTPLAIGGELSKNRRSHLLHVVARLTPGATTAQAEAELHAFAAGVMQQNREWTPGFRWRSEICTNASPLRCGRRCWCCWAQWGWCCWQRARMWRTWC
jgi:hypothetical protein